jgi:hypothetical protein
MDPGSAAHRFALRSIRGTHSSLQFPDSIFKQPLAIVIASEAKQSMFGAAKKKNGLLRRSAPRNDGEHASAFPRR